MGSSTSWDKRLLRRVPCTSGVFPRARDLLPVRVRKCKPRGLLAQIVYIDLVGLKDREQARQKLLEGIDLARAKPDQEPDMPAPDMTTDPVHPPQAQEPPWPPAPEVAANVAGSVFWRLIGVAAVRAHRSHSRRARS